MNTEAQLAAHVVEWLEARNLDVYQEVQLNGNGPVADIVALRGFEVWVIECKMSLGLAVMEQAHGWRRYAHFAAVACPEATRKQRDGRAFAETALRALGVGCFAVSESGAVRQAVDAMVANVRRADLDRWLRTLNPGHKTFAAAGNADGRRWSRFQQTLLDLAAFARAHPGETLAAALEAVPTHYRSKASARSALEKWHGLRGLRGLELRRTGRELTLWAKEGA